MLKRANKIVPNVANVIQISDDDKRRSNHARHVPTRVSPPIIWLSNPVVEEEKHQRNEPQQRSGKNVNNPVASSFSRKNIETNEEPEHCNESERVMEMETSH